MHESAPLVSLVEAPCLCSVYVYSCSCLFCVSCTLWLAFMPGVSVYLSELDVLGHTELSEIHFQFFVNNWSD